MLIPDQIVIIMVVSIYHADMKQTKKKDRRKKLWIKGMNQAFNQTMQGFVRSIDYSLECEANR